MIIQKRKELITLDLIFSKLSRFDIYKFYVTIPFKIGVSFNSIFRKDPCPSMTVYEGKDGKLHHIDYGASEYKGGPVDLVMQLYQLTLRQAIEKIARDFGLTEGTDSYKKIIEAYKQPVINRKVQCKLQVTTKSYTDRDREYWRSYGITLKDLRENNIYSIGELYVNRKRYPIKAGELAFVYYYEDGMKCYFPERSKEEGKWLSSISTSKVEGMENLNGHPEVIITKATKDRLVLSRIFPDLEVINTQNESCSAFTESLIEKLKQKIVYIAFDSDPPGKRASTIITQKFGYKHINTPDRYLPLKDWSDVYKEYGAQPIIEHFKQKGVIK